MNLTRNLERNSRMKNLFRWLAYKPAPHSMPVGVFLLCILPGWVGCVYSFAREGEWDVAWTLIGLSFVTYLAVKWIYRL